jgi:predicted enzyme involved in methoxymalonyl-ACP biosynthesis
VADLHDTTITAIGVDNMAEVPLEFHDLRQMKLWRRQIFEIHDRYVEVFEEQALDDDLRKILNSLDELLNTLSTKISYDVKIARVREFLSELDKFRVATSRYLGKIAEQLYKDVREVIDGVFNVSEEVEG